MKFRVKLAYEDSETRFWWQDYNVNTDDPQKWAEKLVENNNRNLERGRTGACAFRSGGHCWKPRQARGKKRK